MPISPQLEHQIAQLSPQDRITLVENILQDLDATDATLDALWAHEAEARLTAYKSGEVQAVPLAEVLAKYTTP